MKQVELIEKRKPREKHFLREDGTILAEVYDTDIHYLKDGKYEEIDNTLVSENGILRNKSNDYKVEFKENFKESLMKMTKKNHYIDFKVRESKIGNIKVYKRKLSKQMKNTTYNNITDDITVEYQALSDKVKETIVLQNSNYSELSFELDTNLILSKENGEIIARDENEKIIFRIEKPYMIDSNKIRNDNVYYKINSFDYGYLLTLVLDEEWLNSNERVYPVYVDPTINNNSQNISLYDTYIYPGDTNDTRSNKPYLKAGVEKVNGNIRPNRTLIKFSLPTIGTGSEIVYATLDLTSYPTNTQYPSERLATIHRVTADWDESTANWNNMNDKFETRVESMFYGSRSVIDGNTVIPHYSYYDGNITNLVKKWYRDTPNYGVMIKAVDENKYVDEDYPIFYSKDNTLSSENNPKPIFSLIYRNHNGLENYLDYRQQSFTDGTAYINTYNGNLTTVFHLGHTVGGNLPVNLGLVYNTNDVILNNEAFITKGYKLSLEQTVKEVTIDNSNYLEYVDEDGTIHYFNNGTDSNIYRDEDGLNITIEKTDSICTMTDSNNGKMTFTKIGNIYRLTKIIDNDGSYVDITLNENNSISKITDQYGSEVNITYNESNTIITSPDMQTILNYSNNLLTNIQTKNGVTTFEYNSNNIISAITDVTGIKMKYEYYANVPYRVNKVTQIGLNDEIGAYFILSYGFDSTSIVDSRGKTTTLIFNSYGNLLSENSLPSGEDIDNAYSINREYGNLDNTKNRILSSENPIKFIKNYLKNASFESDTNYFEFDNERIAKSYSTDEYVSGNRALKIETLMAGQSIEQALDVPKGEYYTFSGYFKTNQNIEIKLMYADVNNNAVISSEIIKSSDIFDRSDVTIYYDENATSNLKLVISFEDVCTTYIDDIQLEKGEVANSFNMIENPDFSEGYSEWELDAWTYGEGDISPNSSFSIAKFNKDKNTALKVSTNPSYGVKFTKTLPVKGKKGDLYTCSFWYKNLGFPGYGPVAGSAVSIYFKPVGHDAEYCIATSDPFNPNEENWQFFTYRSHAPEDFESIKLVFLIGREANDFYLTNLSLYKDVTSGEYSYDENGNLISITDQSDNTNIFKYDKNNQLISMTNAIGKNFKYEYDNNKIDRVLSAISSSGVSNRIIYDKNGNPVTTRISKKHKKEIIDGLYKIRNKGTNKYLKAELNLVLMEENECSNTIWKLEKNGDYFKIIYAINPEYSISYRNGAITLDTEDTNNLFQFEKNNDSLNGTYYIKYNESTAAGGTNVRFLTINGNNVEANTFSELSSNIEFYIELKEDIFIENNAEYTEDGRFLTKIIDSSLSEIAYDTNSTTGQLNSVTDSSGYSVEYNYNDKGQITSVSQGNKTITYNYNDKNLISSISQDNRKYCFSYDGFLNAKEVKIGDNITYVTKEYENNNGNLASITYGNNQQLTYEYDKFDRIKTFHKMNDDYNYKFDNYGNISKIISNNHLEKCKYDVGNRLYRYNIDNFEMRYTYNSENEVEKQTYQLNNVVHSVENLFDDDEFLIKSILDEDEINYSHDSLGRLININLGNNYNVNYGYMTNGKRTTEIVNKLQNGNDEYKYTYDKLNNITQQFLNNVLTNEYSYDEHNELIQEKNHLLNELIEYNYDNYVNILSTKTKRLDTGEIIKTNNYQYNNENWLDQLTNYNGNNLTYDQIGNPIKVGKNIDMTWINGRELESYSDSDKSLNVSYEYNADGYRISKTVNGIKTKYHLEGSNIIYEETGNDLIYYLYDYTGIIGLVYNGEKFYYVKNLQGDIIGILNGASEQIVTYEYDIWGKIIGIKDKNGNLITDSENIGYINPFRYRGYYYDQETELYYLNSRYYNPEWKRFINPDTIICANSDLVSLNLYTYVSNNPVMFSDPSGHGLLSKIVKKVKKAAKKVAKAVAKAAVKVATTVAKAVTTVVKAVPKVVGQVFSYSVGASSNTIERSYGINNIVTVDAGTNYSNSATIFGNSNSLIQVTQGPGSMEIALNTSFITLKINKGTNEASASVGFKIEDDVVYNGVVGFENFKLFAGYQTDNISDTGTYGNFGRFSVNGGIVAVVVLAVVAPPVKISIPALKAAARIIGALA